MHERTHHYITISYTNTHLEQGALQHLQHQHYGAKRGILADSQHIVELAPGVAPELEPHHLLELRHIEVVVLAKQLPFIAASRSLLAGSFWLSPSQWSFE